MKSLVRSQWSITLGFSKVLTLPSKLDFHFILNNHIKFGFSIMPNRIEVSFVNDKVIKTNFSLTSRQMTASVKNEIYKNVSNTLRRIYQSAYLPLCKEPYSTQILKNHMEEVLGYATRTKTRILQDKPTFFNKYHLDRMYHFAIKCHCFEFCGSIDEIKRKNCQCPKSIPSLPFYADQMFDRARKIPCMSEDEKTIYQELFEGKY